MKPHLCQLLSVCVGFSDPADNNQNSFHISAKDAFTRLPQSP